MGGHNPDGIPIALEATPLRTTRRTFKNGLPGGHPGPWQLPGRFASRQDRTIPRASFTQFQLSRRRISWVGGAPRSAGGVAYAPGYRPISRMNRSSWAAIVLRVSDLFFPIPLPGDYTAAASGGAVSTRSKEPRRRRAVVDNHGENPGGQRAVATVGCTTTDVRRRSDVS